MTADLSTKWDYRYIKLAKFISVWSKDPKAKVGAVLLNARGWPIALGYNGFPVGVEDDVEKLNDDVLKNQMVVHAEQNALLCAGDNARDGTIYVFGKPICPRCAVLIIQSGIKHVYGVRPNPAHNPGSETHRLGPISVKMFKEASISFSPIDPILDDAARRAKAGLKAALSRLAAAKQREERQARRSKKP